MVWLPPALPSKIIIVIIGAKAEEYKPFHGVPRRGGLSSLRARCVAVSWSLPQVPP
jgi:hypothetical protein